MFRFADVVSLFHAVACERLDIFASIAFAAAMLALPHVWTAPNWQELFWRCCSIGRVRSLTGDLTCPKSSTMSTLI
jgi:hypothetical protein